MTAAEAVLSDIAGLGVPWWGWGALLLMIFWGLLVGAGGPEPAAEPDEHAALGRLP